MEKPFNVLASKIKRAREVRNVTQERLAELILEPLEKIQQLERGEVDCTICFVKRVAIALDIPLDCFFGQSLDFNISDLKIKHVSTLKV